MVRSFQRILYCVVARVFLRIRVKGMEHVLGASPAVLVANHLGSFGPLSVITSLPTRLFPWVTHEITDRKCCSSYVRREFTERELKLSPPLSGYVSELIACGCVRIMRAIRAVPVYKRSKRIHDTLLATVRLLEKGERILIFPEIPPTGPTAPLEDTVTEFQSGFIRIAKLYYEKTKATLAFLPLAVNRKRRCMRIGKPVYFDAARPYAQERRRLKAELEGAVQSMYSAIEYGSSRSRSRPIEHRFSPPPT